LPAAQRELGCLSQRFVPAVRWLLFTRAGKSSLSPVLSREVSMTEKEEKAYEEGNRQAWISMLQSCLQNLHGLKNLDTVKIIQERQQAIQILRSLCEEFGDNNWDDDLHLSDIIDKHLGKYLHSSKMYG